MNFVIGVATCTVILILSTGIFMLLKRAERWQKQILDEAVTPVIDLARTIE